MTGAKNFTGIFQTKAAAAMPHCSNGRKKCNFGESYHFSLKVFLQPLRLTLISNIKVGHLLSKSKSKLAIEVCDQILLSKVIGKVSESWCQMWIESEFTLHLLIAKLFHF